MYNCFRFRNMSVVQVDSCKEYLNIPSARISSYADGWIEPKLIDGNCTLGVDHVNQTSSCSPNDVENSQQQCAPIRNAADGIGTFGNCKPMGVMAIGTYYKECVFDDCKNETTRTRTPKLCEVRRWRLVFKDSLLNFDFNCRHLHSLCIDAKEFYQIPL